MRHASFLHNEWKNREQAWQKEFVKYYFKEPVLLLTDPCVTLLQLAGTHAWKWGKNLACGLWKNIWESSSLLALFFKIHHVFSGAVNYLNLTDKRMEALGLPKVTSLLGVEPFRKVFITKLFCFSPSLMSWTLSLYCSLAIFISFYLSSKQKCRTVSVPATASPFQMVWLSFPQHYFLTLFPASSLLYIGLG